MLALDRDSATLVAVGTTICGASAIAASIISGLGIVPRSWTAPLGQLSAWLIAAVLAAIGTSLTWRQLRTAGARPLLFGGTLAVILAVSSLALLTATGWR
ncbi:putative sulfate exporter family transporter [Nocardia sp. CA-135398]|uniref:putative sulfate exporter family transporter n=1 Tax=Nocardia sp. CA-135398 TaxID=3239977 RepID=UPI003D9858FD